MGRRVPPRIPTFPPSPDLGDLKRVFSLLHIHQLALSRADETPLLRPDQPRLLRLDLLAELEEAIDQRFGPHGAPRDADVRRHERVRTLHDRVRVIVRPPADRPLPLANTPLRPPHRLSD